MLWKSSNSTITNCNAYNNSCNGIYLAWDSNNNTITNCNVYNNSWHGIILKDSSNNNTITNCNVYNNSYDGICLYSSTNNTTITKCSVYNNSWDGIYLRNSSNNEVHYSNIYNNMVYGVNNSNNESKYVVNATYNWWGSPDGPGGVGPGSGDEVSANVLYDPWLTKPTPTQLKETVVIEVSDKQGFYDDLITLEAQVLDNDGETLLHGPYEVEFKVDDEVVGLAQIDEDGNAKIEWRIDFIPKEVIEEYPIIITFSGNEYYLPAQGQGEFTLKSAKWLKNDSISQLEAAKSGDWKIDKRIDGIIFFIQKSLDEDLWLNASRLVFVEKGKKFDPNKLEKMFDKPKCTGPKMGIAVFHYEKVAVRLMMNESKFGRPEDLKDTFENVIGKLVKADFLLAKVSLYDAKHTSVKNPVFQKIVDRQIKLAEKEIQRAKEELAQDRPDKAIMRLSKSWLHSQLAIKLAQEGKPSLQKVKTSFEPKTPVLSL